jgi:DHA1 family putative efflux transporter-like MFS transporter
MKDTLKIYLLALICFLVGASEFVIVGIMDQISASANISLSAAGQLLTVYAIAGAIGTPIFIMVMGKMDRRKVLVISLAVVVIGCIMMVAFSNYGALLLARIIMAIGGGIFSVTCYTIAAKLAMPGRQAGAIATITTGYNAALILGLPMGRVLSAALGWKAIFWGTGILSFLSIFLVALLIPSTEGEKSTPISEQLALLKSPKVLLTLAITLFWLTGYSIPYSYITPFLKAVSPMSEEMISMVLLGFGIATLIGNKLGGFLGDRIGISKSIVGSIIVQVIGLVLLSTIAGPTVLTIILVIIWGIASWTPGPIQSVNIMAVAPESSAMLLSLNSSFIQLAFAAGAAIGGVVIGGSSIFTLTWAGAVLAVISIFIALASFRLRRSSEDSLAVE